MFKVFLAVIYVIFLQFELFAQTASNKPKILFESGDYNASLEASIKLLETLPNDPIYNYYAGASLFQIGKNYEKCLDYFEKADSRLTPKELWLYKGKTLLYLFRFDESKRAFELYAQNFSLRNALTGENTDWPRAVNNTKSAVQQTQEIILLKRDTTNRSGIIDYFNEFDNATGQWVDKNPDYFENQGIQPGEGFYYHYFKKTEDQCFVITGKKNLLKPDLDIFYTCASGDIFEQTFQSLPAFINSRKDQRYPIYDEETQTLYFSSQDDKGLGGYDIFYSTYDKLKDRWGYPKNMGFPLNSPFDDYLIGTGNEGELILATNRYQEQNNFEVLLIKQGKATENISDENTLLTKSKFLKEIKPKVIDEELTSAIQKLKNENLQENKEQSPKAEQTKEPKIEYKRPKPFSNEKEYQKQLDYALTLQLKADSVGRLADEKRYKLADIKDQRLRIEEIKAIEIYEAEAEEIQKEADIAFAKVRKLELEEEAKNNDRTEKNNSNSNTPQKQSEAYFSNDFKIYSSSPYSSQNPFNFNYTLPKGLLYRIQMGVFSKEIAYDYFGGLSPVTGELIDERGLKKYYIGLFSNFSEADKALQKIQQQGFIDSFIVAWFNGKKVSINRAAEIEKELAK